MNVGLKLVELLSFYLLNMERYGIIIIVFYDFLNMRFYYLEITILINIKRNKSVRFF